MADTTIPPRTLESLLERLHVANLPVAKRFPGEREKRQPVHTVYGGAHLFKADAAAKLGVVALARIIAMENQSRGITANVICPSADTRMTRSVPTPKDPAAAALREERLRRSRADAIAPLCVYLASEQAAHVNGQVFHQRAAELSLYGHMRPLRMVHHQGGWTPELIAEVAMPSLATAFTPLDARGVHSGMPME